MRPAAVHLVVAAVFAAIAAVSLSGQTRGRSATPDRSWSVPRTPWGHPDLQGRWTNRTLTTLERASDFGAKEFFTEAEATEYRKVALERLLAANNLTQEAEISGEFVEGIWAEDRDLVATGRTSLIVGPTGRVPMSPEARARIAARGPVDPTHADSPEERTLAERCLYFPVEGPPMIPSVVYNSNYEILQTPSYVVILIELGNGRRIIPIDGRPHLADNIREWHGDSRGRWEGDTLVVETTNFNEKRNFRGSTDKLHVVERFRRVRDDMIMYTFTATDPTTWTEPWTAEIPMMTLNELMYEFACHEGNLGLEHIMRGARAAESQATK